jgi:hypothetical protein
LTNTTARQRLAELRVDGHSAALGDLVEPDVIAERTVESNHEPHADVRWSMLQVNVDREYT